MERRPLLYLDNCVFSSMLEPSGRELKEFFRDFPCLVVYSDIHLLEMQHNAVQYCNLLTELDAVFVRNPSDTRYHPISSIEPGEPHIRFSHHSEFASAFATLEAMLYPLRYLLGSRRDVEMEEVARVTGARMKSSLSDLFATIGEGEFKGLSSIFNADIDEITTEMQALDVSKNWDKLDAQRRRARNGDPMRAMTSIEKIGHLFSTITESERAEILGMFPENFARIKNLCNGDLAGFVMLLFALGLVKGKGVLAGKQQERKFSAQFRDAMHIEEASRCDCFITYDKDASDLAAATFSYAGFPTKSVLLKVLI